jgi:hypothetical protein
LTDFGGDTFREGLEILVNSLNCGSACKKDPVMGVIGV